MWSLQVSMCLNQLKNVGLEDDSVREGLSLQRKDLVFNTETQCVKCGLTACACTTALGWGLTTRAP